MTFVLKIRVEPGQTWRDLAGILIDLGLSLRHHVPRGITAPDGAAITHSCDPEGDILGAWEVRADHVNRIKEDKPNAE